MLTLARPFAPRRSSAVAEEGVEQAPQPSPAARSRRGSLYLLVPAPWLALGVVFLIGFRIALNVTDSNVIDVGYAGVIGAQRLVHGKPLYGGYPSDNEHGDTYGPVTYEAYVPFVQIFGWSGTWDDLPAAHAAAIVFDLLAVALIFLLGRRVRGPTLGIALAYAWVSYPFTLYALESNSNDALVAVLVLATMLFARAADPGSSSIFRAAGERGGVPMRSPASSPPFSSPGRSPRSPRCGETRCTRSTSGRSPTRRIAARRSRCGGSTEGSAAGSRRCR